MKFFKIVGFSIIGLILFAFVWGSIEPYTIGVNQYEVAIPNLPEHKKGDKFAVIGDFQVGFWLDNIHTIQRVIDLIVDSDPKFVLILGDFIYKGGEVADDRIALAASLLVPISQVDIPIYAVLGNHDYSVISYTAAEIDYQRAAQLTQALEKVGVIVLVNDNVEIWENIYIVGIGSYLAQNSKIEGSFDGLPESAARIVMMHNPATFEEIPANQAPLAFAGHTHGGQVSLPFTPNWSLITCFTEEDTHFDGWIENYGQEGNQLYVNRGIGMSLVPFRISAQPELTIITLK